VRPPSSMCDATPLKNSAAIYSAGEVGSSRTGSGLVTADRGSPAMKLLDRPRFMTRFNKSPAAVLE